MLYIKFFIYFASFVAISPLNGWVLGKSVNHTNLHNKSMYNNANLVSLGKMFIDIQDIFGTGGWNTTRNLVTQSIIQNIQEIPVTKTVQSVL